MTLLGSGFIVARDTAKRAASPFANSSLLGTQGWRLAITTNRILPRISQAAEPSTTAHLWLGDNLSMLAIERFESEYSLEKLPDAYDVTDENRYTSFANIPELVGGRQWRFEVEVPAGDVSRLQGQETGNLLVHDCSNDCKDCHGKYDHKKGLARRWESGDQEHDTWQNNQTDIGRDIKDHLRDRIMAICSALHIFDRHCPILVEGSTDDCIVVYLNENESKDDIN